MYQVMKMSNKIYAEDVSNLDKDEQLERIEGFISEGRPIILCENLEDLEDLEIFLDEIQIIKLI